MGTHQAFEPQRRAGRPLWSQEGREAVKTRGCQETLGSHQEQQTPGPREQAILHTRRQDAAHLWKGKGPCFRYGQVPQDSSDCLNIINISFNINQNVKKEKKKKKKKKGKKKKKKKKKKK